MLPCLITVLYRGESFDMFYPQHHEVVYLQYEDCKVSCEEKHTLEYSCSVFAESTIFLR